MGREGQFMNVVELRGSGLWSPDEVFDRAKAQWREITARSDTLARLDSPWLAEYALCVVLGQMINAEIRDGGLLPGGKTSPWLQADNMQVAHLIMLSTRLGLNPQARFYRQRKAEVLAAAATADKEGLAARLDAIEERLAEQDCALQTMEGVRASIEATRQDLEDLCLHLLGEAE